MKSFIISQMSYCPLIWMTQSRGVETKINHIHEITLRIIHKDLPTPFGGLLAKDKSVTSHNRNPQQLLTVIFVKCNINHKLSSI